jgi:hypothetical protein
MIFHCKGSFNPYEHSLETDYVLVFKGLVASSGIEPELSALRGRRVNQLHHDATHTVL